MMSDRVLVVLKEGQMLKSLESLSVYCESPLDSTVLVILMHGGGVDKRKALYKAVSKNGVVVDSPLVRDYELPRWIEGYYKSRGLDLEPGGANLIAESVGGNWLFCLLVRLAIRPSLPCLRQLASYMPPSRWCFVFRR